MPQSQKPETKLTLTLSGIAGAESSTVAAEIAHHLYGLGFNVDWKDSTEWYRLTQKPDHAEKLKEIAEKSGLTIGSRGLPHVYLN